MPRRGLSTGEPLPRRSVDAVVSKVVLEHVGRPLQRLEAVDTALRVGRAGMVVVQLHRGPLPSHRCREVFVPWPHLLFEPSVCTAFYRKHHREEVTFSWVTRMTLGEYMAACKEVGQGVERWSREVADFDVAFYRRFEDRLVAYPAIDLETNSSSSCSASGGGLVDGCLSLTLSVAAPRARAREGARDDRLAVDGRSAIGASCPGTAKYG